MLLSGSTRCVSGSAVFLEKANSEPVLCVLPLFILFFIPNKQILKHHVRVFYLISFKYLYFLHLCCHHWDHLSPKYEQELPNRVSQVVLPVKTLPANAGEAGLIPGLGKIPWRREWQPTPVLLPGEFHGQRSLVGSMGLQRVGHG